MDKKQNRSKLPVSQKIAYGIGGGANNLMASAINQLAFQIYSMGLGLSASKIGLALGIPRLWDAITDPLMGNISDNTRSRWGRRRPYIAVGAVLSGILFAGLWMFGRDWSHGALFAFFLTVSILFFTAFTVWFVPWTALGCEITYDYKERTSVQAYKTFMMSLAGMSMPWLYKLCLLSWDKLFQAGPAGLGERLQAFAQQSNMELAELHGVRYVGILLGAVIILTGLAPVFCKEKATAQAQGKIKLGKAFLTTLKNRPFLLMSGSVFFLLVGLNLVGPMGVYVNLYHVCEGDKNSMADIVGWGGMLWQGLGLLSVPLMTWLSNRFGKRRVLISAMLLVVLSSVMRWWLYTPANMYLQLISLAVACPGTTAVWIITGSMLADITDEDELRSGLRREGMYGAVYSWIFKVGLASVMSVSGVLVDAAGVIADAPQQSAETIFSLRWMFAFVPAVLVLMAVVLIWFYPLNEKRAHEVREELDAREQKKRS